MDDSVSTVVIVVNYNEKDFLGSIRKLCGVGGGEAS